MRILIYLLAMLTGFSAAEAARPVAAVPAAVDAAVGGAYVAAAVKVTETALAKPLSDVRFSVLSPTALVSVDAVSAVIATTPVLRHDVILG